MTTKHFTAYGGFMMCCDDIQDWQRETFPAVVPTAAFERLEEELRELGDELHSLPDTTVDAVMDEVADCFIVLNQIALALGGDFGAAVQRKMTKNLNRKWDIRADGTGQHVTE